MINEKITEHFDKIAHVYDNYKKKNSYYYDFLKELYKSLIPDASSKKVLEVGCGTGSLIMSIKPKYGVGIDVSKNMIDIAKKRKSSVKFKVMSAEEIRIKEKFDYIFLADVIEHLSSVDKAIKNLNNVSNKDTKIIISMGNPLWEPALGVAERLGLKMPEGPHNRITSRGLISIVQRNGFKVISRGYRLLVPKKIPLIYRINAVFYKIPLIRNLGLTEYVILKKK